MFYEMNKNLYWCRLKLVVLYSVHVQLNVKITVKFSNLIVKGFSKLVNKTLKGQFFTFRKAVAKHITFLRIKNIQESVIL